MGISGLRFAGIAGGYAATAAIDHFYLKKSDENLSNADDKGDDNDGNFNVDELLEHSPIEDDKEM